MTDNLLEAALRFAERGYPVFPLHGIEEYGCSCGRPACESPGKHPRTANGVKDASIDGGLIRRWWQRFPFANIGIATGAPSGLVVVDVDCPLDTETIERLGLDQLTLTASTGRGHHLYFEHRGVALPNRVGIAPGVDVRANGGYVVAPPSIHATGALYDWQRGIADDGGFVLAPLPSALHALLTTNSRVLRPAPAALVGQSIPNGQRNAQLTSIVGSLFARGMSREDVLAEISRVNEERCRPPLFESEVLGIVKSIASRESAKNMLHADEESKKWPSPLAPEALHGFAGEVINAISPHSEADPAALLLQFLVAFGNAAGRHAHFVVEANKHFTNLFVLIVGNTSKGRKGSSLSHVLRLFEEADPDWVKYRVNTGLSSGEGLIWAVRDASETSGESNEQSQTKTKKENGQAGISDKRLLLVESEFSSVLKRMTGDGNTISAVVRLAWDSGTLQTITKNSPVRASNAHVSIIGHITSQEFQKSLRDTDIANGFANRFLIIGVRRSKLLPFGGALTDDDYGRLADMLRAKLIVARSIGRMHWSKTARARWSDEYTRLSRDDTGLFGAVVSRAEAQVTRLACMYALLDGSEEISVEHLEAALAVWKYAEDTARFLFARSLGDPVADRLLFLIREQANGVSRTEIRDHFQRHARKEEVERALGLLNASGLIRRVNVPGTDGRTAEIWRATDATEATKAEPPP